MQKKSLLFFSFPSDSNFDEVKVTNKREKHKMKTKVFIFISECQ